MMLNTRKTVFGMAMALFVSSSVIGAPVASAQGACDARATILKTLEGKYQESQRALGVVGSSGVVEIYVSDKGTWTVLVTSASGRTCILAAGHSWEQVAPKIMGTGI